MIAWDALTPKSYLILKWIKQNPYKPLPLYLQTTEKRMRDLERQGYIAQLRGDREGFQITEKGNKMISKFY